MSNNSWYVANTQLVALDIHQVKSMYYGDFGIIWWIWKPHGLATTQGKQLSLLDILINDYHQHPLVQWAMKEFGISEELGMLTRLDNDTAGMVWFAHTHEGKSLWLQAQSEGKINKIYEADVIGRVREDVTIDTPIMHHRYDETKMITINKRSDIDKGRWNTHQVSTHIIPWVISWSNTHIQVVIHQWCRHQIRVHCACYGNPIIGDNIYHKQHMDTTLHLWSVGLERDQLKEYIIINYHDYDDSNLTK
jgi:23S rRNA-/tRNA-specific pseudouridylate synthase